MKYALITPLIAIAFALPVTGSAADELAGHGGHAAHAPAPTSADLIEGLVKKVDNATGKVTISHGPLPNGMPAMTMVFRLKEADRIKQLKEGDHIRFAAENIGGTMVLVHFERAK